MRSRSLAAVWPALICIAGSGGAAGGQTGAHRRLGAADIDAIARLEMMEDRRQLDSADVSELLSAAHPEVRRRAALTVARIPADKRGVALLRARPLDQDTAVAATVVFAVGQLRDAATITWFDSLLSNARTAPTVATEAAVALGKIKTAAAREVLARYLEHTTATSRTTLFWPRRCCRSAGVRRAGTSRRSRAGHIRRTKSSGGVPSGRYFVHAIRQRARH